MAGGDLPASFAAAMARLGPFEPTPRLAAGVSGGADSMALALLAQAWVQERCGSLLALVVDHGLRAESAAEAETTVARLGANGIAAKVLTIAGLTHGAALAARARAARFAALQDACAAAGLVHLLLGHHAGDQAETVLIRVLGGSGSAGLAGMADIVETPRLRILRPLLAIPPVRLRDFLAAAGTAWVEDPSNADRAALRPRLRLLRRDHRGTGAATHGLAAAAEITARQRAVAEADMASLLARHAVIRPEGFAVLSGEPIDTFVLRALLQTVAGAPFPPALGAVAQLAAVPRAATLAGVRLMPAGRLGPGWLLVREPAAMAAPVPARPGAVWDGRFRLGMGLEAPSDARLGALGADAARLRHVSPLPAAVLRTLPAIRVGTTLLAVPHLVYPDATGCECYSVLFSPPRPAAAAPFGMGMHDGWRHPMLL